MLSGGGKPFCPILTLLVGLLRGEATLPSVPCGRLLARALSVAPSTPLSFVFQSLFSLFCNFHFLLFCINSTSQLKASISSAPVLNTTPGLGRKDSVLWTIPVCPARGLAVLSPSSAHSLPRSVMFVWDCVRVSLTPGPLQRALGQRAVNTSCPEVTLPRGSNCITPQPPFIHVAFFCCFEHILSMK